MTAPAPTPFVFTRAKKARFLARYVLDKTVGLTVDLERGRLRLFVYEAVYSVCRLLGRAPLPMRWLSITEVHSRFGRFFVRIGTIDVACASPAFERPDVDRLLAELADRTADGREVLFVDVGADLGTYAVAVARRLPGTRAVAFEPSRHSHELLTRNITANGLADRVVTRRAACGDGGATTAVLTYDPAEPGSSGVRPDLVHGGDQEVVTLTTLDRELAAEAPDVLAVKLDVEGYEVNVLEGARDVIARSGETLLLVEDFVDDSVVRYLQDEDWTFVDKLTPYNSFWRKVR